MTSGVAQLSSRPRKVEPAAERKAGTTSSKGSPERRWLGGLGQKAEQGVEAAVARGGEGGERLAAAVHGLYENEIYAQLGEELHWAAVLGQAVGLRRHPVGTVAVFQGRDAAGDQARDACR